MTGCWVVANGLLPFAVLHTQGKELNMLSNFLLRSSKTKVVSRREITVSNKKAKNICLAIWIRMGFARSDISNRLSDRDSKNIVLRSLRQFFRSDKCGYQRNKKLVIEFYAFITFIKRHICVDGSFLASDIHHVLFIIRDRKSVV